MNRISVGRPRRRGAGLPVAAALWMVLFHGGPAAASPEIRLSDRNRVPACVTPEKLMRFLRERNPELPKRFASIAQHYKTHGEKFRVRWDYAFFQMLLETNHLSYRTGRGSWGDVDPKQNNFAGIGATGGGVPGEKFNDVSSGVLAQIQHLVAYSGERVDKPVSSRTSEVQDDVIAKSKRLGRPVTFRDLTMRWAIDRRYHRSIEAIADRFRAAHCTGDQIAETEAEPGAIPRRGAKAGRSSDGKRSTPPTRAAAAPPQPEADTEEVLVEEDEETTPKKQTGTRTARAAEPTPAAVTTRGQQLTRDAASVPAERQAQGPGSPAEPAPVALMTPPAPAPRPVTCKVWTASYGGIRNVLIRRLIDNELHYTALQVLDGQENALAASFIRTHAAGGEPIGEFADRQAALLKAFDLCPQHARAGD